MVEKGLGNLQKHLENIRQFGETPVVAMNRFPADTEEEIEVVRRDCEEHGAPFAIADVFAKGGEGGAELAECVMAHAESKSVPYRPLYDWSEPIKEKMRKSAQRMYGADDVNWTKEAERDLDAVRRFGLEGLPLCVAKTQKSLSDDPTLLGRPEQFDATVRRLTIAAGAGYLVPFLGDIVRMPGLPKSPQAERLDLENGKVVGISST
jgi:formate--tetrahydrofolate ligase